MGQNILSFRSSATLAAYRGVALDAGNSVNYPASNQSPYVGVTKDESENTSQAAQVAGIGEKTKLLFNDTCAVGALVGLDASGRGITFALPATTAAATLQAQYIGVLTARNAVSATGTIAEILIQPGFMRAGL